MASTQIIPTQDVSVRAGGRVLPGLLQVPIAPIGLVVFAHGSGSSRLSPRNRMVADDLAEAGIATLLFDLLSERESEFRDNVFDVRLLADRLELATEWVTSELSDDLPLGYFGASTGAAAALWAAANLGAAVRAVVSRGGRPDLAAQRLDTVLASTLLIVGERDPDVLALNELARRRLGGKARLEIVPGATHLFDEPGALEQAALLARRWFVDNFSAGTSTARES